MSDPDGRGDGFRSSASAARALTTAAHKNAGEESCRGSRAGLDGRWDGTCFGMCASRASRESPVGGALSAMSSSDYSACPDQTAEMTPNAGLTPSRPR